ncbi:F10K1.18 protein putative isoform 1 [Tripterygium wilfordii]|uniref:F10K1.18 protein putative isoform 1 n=1 Tax=Tripterygium wilfordii TaxID=458696 RepID=A0A7J7DDV6_TRIWF|nr:F10K1.18 protein putative isoform 1 [Tripterygium wilfordii]
MQHKDSGSEINCLKQELGNCLARNGALEKENQELRQEVARLKGQISSLRAHDNERKSMLWKKLQNSTDSTNKEASPEKLEFVKTKEQSPEVEYMSTRADYLELAATKERAAAVLKPPPRPAAFSPSHKEVIETKAPPKQAPLAPPLPPKMLVGTRSLRRVPDVVEMYRSLTRRDAHMDNRTNPMVAPAAAFSKNMIGEIENRSTYLSAIKSDVEKQKEFICFLIKEVESASFGDISDVEVFVKWLDKELSSLVDERAVLKHFPQWPERKADAVREAACNFRDLRNLEAEVSSYEDNPKESSIQALRNMQALQDRQRSVSSTERTRETLRKRYSDFYIPWEWMFDTGLIGQMKLSSLRLAKKYMKRVTRELQLNEGSAKENLLLQGIRFAYRVHQFAGGFNAEAIQAFEEFKVVSLGSHK